MSQGLASNNHTTNQADDRSVASRTRRQTRTRARDEEDEQKQSADQPSSHVSPAMRIYRHALESVLGMLNLGDLSRALAVCRDCAAAARSMAPIHSCGEADDSESAISGRKAHAVSIPIARIVASPLLRHLAAVQLWRAGKRGTYLNNASLALLAQHAPNLTSLHCSLVLTTNEPLILPAKLTTLEFRLDDEYPDAVINGVLTALAAPPSLAQLRLALSAFRHETTIELTLLSACPSLTDLALEDESEGSPALTSTQLGQVRSSLGHLQRLFIGWMDSNKLARLLKLPVTARWRDIGEVIGDVRTGELLLRLPSLTKLDLRFEWEAPMDFLPQLPQLTSLTLDCYHTGGQQPWSISPDDLLASLALCNSLSELDAMCGFKSAHWSALFAKLTSIKKLTIRGGALDTLRCFASGPITESLQVLSLQHLNLPPPELPHLYNLGRLRTLHLINCFSPRLADATIARLVPPTSLLPALTKLVYVGLAADGEWDHRKRQGPSFEWMQQRLKQ